MKINIAKINFNGGSGGSSTTIEALSVVENGVYEAPKGTAYTPVTVDVPIPTFSTEEKTVSITGNGQTVVDKSADKDGMTKVTVDVNVPAPEPKLEALSVTTNGKYIPSTGVDGYSSVDVNVAGGAGEGTIDFGQVGYDNSDTANYVKPSDFAYTKQRMAEWDKQYPDNVQDFWRNDPNLVVYPKLLNNEKTSNNSCDYRFQNDINLRYLPSLDWSDWTARINNSFENCVSLQTAPMIKFSINSPVENYGLYGLFNGCTGLKDVPSYNINETNMTVLDGVFRDCKSLEKTPDWDTSKIKNLYYCFSGCESLKTVTWDFSSAENCDSLFRDCKSLTSIDGLNFTKMKNGNGFLANCYNFGNGLTEVTFDMPELTSANYFLYCNTGRVTDSSTPYISFTFNNLPNLISASSMFWGRTHMDRLVMHNLNKLTEVSGMFDEADANHIEITGLNSLTHCNYFISGIYNLKDVKLTGLSSAINLEYLINDCNNYLTKIEIEGTSKAENMTNMIYGCSNLIEIGEIDCSSVKSMLSFNYNFVNVTTLGGFKNLKVSLKMAGESWQPADKLTKESLMNVINDLGQADPTFEAEPQLTIAATPYALLTPEDIAIATAKGWKVVSQ